MSPELKSKLGKLIVDKNGHIKNKMINKVREYIDTEKLNQKITDEGKKRKQKKLTSNEIKLKNKMDMIEANKNKSEATQAERNLYDELLQYNSSIITLKNSYKYYLVQVKKSSNGTKKSTSLSYITLNTGKKPNVLDEGDGTKNLKVWVRESI